MKNQYPKSHLKLAFEELQNRCIALKEELETLHHDNKASIDSLQNQLKTISGEYEDSSTELASLKTEHSLLSDKYDTIKVELSDMTTSLKQITEERDTLDALKKENENKIEKNEELLKEYKEKLQNIETQLQTIILAKQKAEEGVNKMNRELFALSREKQELEGNQKIALKDLQKKTAVLEKEKRQLSDKLNEKEKDITRLNEELATLENTVKSLESEKNEKRKEVEEWKSKFQNHDNLVPKLTDKLKSLATS